MKRINKKIVVLAMMCGYMFNSFTKVKAENYCVFPVQDNYKGRISNNFGDWRTDIGGKCHAGIDLYTSGNGAIQAIADGEVIYRADTWSSYSCDGGPVGEIIIEHTLNGVAKSVRYAEINSGTIPSALTEGSQVTKGQFLGNATHCGMLHMEVWDQGTTNSSGWASTDGRVDNCVKAGIELTPGLNNPTELVNNLNQGICSFGDNLSSTMAKITKQNRVFTTKASVCVGNCPADDIFSGGVEGKCFPLVGEFSFGDTWGASRSYGGSRTHKGTDVMSPTGTPIVAITDGLIHNVGWDDAGGWRVTMVDSTNPDLFYYYAHMSDYAPFLSQYKTANGTTYKPTNPDGSKIAVKTGQLIGYVGDSGYGPTGTTGQFESHLHFSIYMNDYEAGGINPYELLRKLETQPCR